MQTPRNCATAWFQMPPAGDLRYTWVVIRLSPIDDAEMRQLVLDAWAMMVPKGVAAAQRGTSACP